MDWLGSRWERGWALLFHYLCESYLRRFECQCLASAASKPIKLPRAVPPRLEQSESRYAG